MYYVLMYYTIFMLFYNILYYNVLYLYYIIMYYIIIFVLYLYWFFMLFLWIGGGQYTESNTQVSIDWLIRRLGKLAMGINTRPTQVTQSKY